MPDLGAADSFSHSGEAGLQELSWSTRRRGERLYAVRWWSGGWIEYTHPIRFFQKEKKRRKKKKGIRSAGPWPCAGGVCGAGRTGKAPPATATAAARCARVFFGLNFSAMSSGQACPSCGCTDIDVIAGGNISACTNCGTLLDENPIVSAVEFSESATGARYTRAHSCCAAVANTCMS